MTPPQPSRRHRATYTNGRNADVSPLEFFVRGSLVVRLVLLLACGGLLLLAPASAFAQTEGEEARVSEVARELSRLEAEGDFDALYDRLHPDVREVVPRAAVVGWYEAQFAASRTAELTVSDVAFGPWTWPVTGKTYARTAAVSFVQPYWVDDERSEVAGVVHLVEEDGEWRWFWGTSRASVNAQIALHAPDELEPTFADPTAAERVLAFPDPLHAHVDAFWEGQFDAAGRRYNPPDGVVAVEEPILTACGRADPATEAAFYCLLDETIYYSGEFRRVVEAQVGDFGWVVVVAHEWGHHIQDQLGIDLGGVPDQAGDPTSLELEQQADCMAGAYTRSADAVGWLAPGDVEEALRITDLAGDPVGTPYDDPYAHGTGAQRVSAFLEGYEAGLDACEFEL